MRTALIDPENWERERLARQRERADRQRLADKRRRLKRLMIDALGYKMDAQRMSEEEDTRLLTEDLVRALERKRLPRDLEQAVDGWPEGHIDQMLAKYESPGPRFIW